MLAAAVERVGTSHYGATAGKRVSKKPSAAPRGGAVRERPDPRDPNGIDYEDEGEDDNGARRFKFLGKDKRRGPERGASKGGVAEVEIELLWDCAKR